MDGHEYAPPRNPSCTPQPNETGIRCEPQCSGVYGFTEADERVPGQFVILIAAQMIWPLLVPEYSTSEKLCCHFMIAVTILHEIMVRKIASDPVIVSALTKLATACYPLCDCVHVRQARQATSTGPGRLRVQTARTSRCPAFRHDSRRR